jgi:hypothetical protein
VSTPANEALARESETLRLELREANRRLREATEQFQAMFEQGMFAARLRLDGRSSTSIGPRSKSAD